MMQLALVAYNKARKFLTRQEEGATLVEYALLVALIAVFCITAIGVLGTSISGLFTDIAATLDGQLSTAP